jgi:hypothetical protein
MSFSVRLKKFFEKHDPERIYMIKKIVRNFAAKEDDVMARLEEIYASGGPSKLVSTGKIKKSKLVENHSDNSSLEEQLNLDAENSDDNAPVVEKKSKKKLIVVIGLVVVLAIGGYFGFSFFVGSSNNDDSHAVEAAEHDTHGEISPDLHAAPIEETQQEEIESPAVLDSSVATPNDSIIDNLNATDSAIESKEQEVIIETVEVLDALGK